MKKSKIIITCFATLLLVAGCRDRATNTKGPAKQTPTDIPELPYVLEGDYSPEPDVMYKVLIGVDTCFVMIDSMDEETLHGHYYQVNASSDSVHSLPFDYDRHWRDRRKEASVYIYQEPEYEPEDDALYRLPKYKVRVQKDIEYGQALGYWCSNEVAGDDSYLKIVTDKLTSSVIRTTQSLTMDVYSPVTDDSIPKRHPLLLLLHGGGFYVGDKQDSCIRALCRYFAQTGYVAVSANYRMGFLPSKKEIERAGYMALQDAHAAMRYLVEHAADYGIDTAQLFVGGASAGAITALNLAFMRDNDRPRSANGNRSRDLGSIAASDNSSKATFRIRGVANLWGAVNNLKILGNSKTAIVSFHGDADQVVPYDNGYPFSDISAQLGRRMFERMYGSKQIDLRANELGYHSKLYTYSGEGHSLHHNADGSWNQKNWKSIRDRMSLFFYDEIAGPRPKIVADSNDSRHFYIDMETAHDVRWHVIGGFILKVSDHDIWVVWRDDEPLHMIKASGKNERDFGFNDKKAIDK